MLTAQIAALVQTRVIPYGDLPYHQQDEEGYCGAASAQMILHGKPFSSPLDGKYDQEVLFSNIHNHPVTRDPNTYWFVHPDALVWGLNSYKTTGDWGFHLGEFKDGDAATRQIISDIATQRVGVIALILGMSHWVVVRGFVLAVGLPASGPPNSWYRPWGVFIYDPLPVRFVATHNDSTDGCGSGGKDGERRNYIAYPTWISEKFTGVQTPYHTSYWEGQYLFVEALPVQPLAGLATQWVTFHGDTGSSEMLTDDPIANAALKGLQEHGLDQNEEWAPLIAHTAPATPYQVEGAEPGRVAYYIVPFGGAGNVPLAVRVHEVAEGRIEFQEAIAADNLDFDALVIASPADAMQSLIGKTFDFDGKIVTVKPGNLTKKPRLMWRPCLQSFSPFRPFYEVSIRDDDGEEHTIYVRAYDLEAFTRLDVDVAGA